MNNIAKETPQSFTGGMKKEWNKIKWPKKATIAKQTAVVVVISAIIIGVIALVDAGAIEAISRFF